MLTEYMADRLTKNNDLEVHFERTIKQPSNHWERHHQRKVTTLTCRQEINSDALLT